MRERRIEIDLGIFWIAISWNFHFTEHIIRRFRRPDLQFCSRAGLAPPKKHVKFGIFYVIF